MVIDFVKMHGLGNDFILIDCLEHASIGNRETASLMNGQWKSLAQGLCDRHFGVGADQVLLLLSSRTHDYRMRIFNADGSEIEMCGNGIRCFAKYIWDRGLSLKDEISVETLAGTITPKKAGTLVTVDMGEPGLGGKDIPLNASGRVFPVTCVSMGNPHAVIVVETTAGYPVHEYGPAIENHPFFPNRTNVEFIEIISEKEINMRVWERGAGETLACGTGASAAAVAAHLKGLAGRETTVHLPGGDLLIQWKKENNRVYMTGPAVAVFTGQVDSCALSYKK